MPSDRRLPGCAGIVLVAALMVAVLALGLGLAVRVTW